MGVIKIKREKFYVYSDIFEAGLSAREIAVFAYLSRCANKDGVAFPSIANIASKCGISRVTVLKCISRLEELGFLKKENSYSKMKNGNYRQTSNKYFIEKNIKNKFDFERGVVQTKHGGGTIQAPGVVQTEHGGSTIQAQEINNEN